MSEWIVRRRYWLAAALLLSTLGLAAGLPHAAVPDNALTLWFLDSDPALERYERLHDRFGNDELILVEIEAGDVFAPAVLEKIEEATRRMEAIEGVYGVHSLLSLRDAVSGEDGLRFERALPPEVREDAPRLAGARERLLANPLFADRVVSRDGRRAMLWVELDVMDDFDARRDALVAAVRAAADGALGHQPHAMAGMGVIFAGLNEVVQRDFGIFASLAYTLVFVCLWLYFRSWRVVLATFGVAIVAVVAALGLYGLAGHQLNMVTVVLPTVLIVLGVADTVHFPAASAHVARERPELVGRAHTVAVLQRLLWPCALTSMTTVIGFFTLASSPMAVVRQFGIYCAFGVAVAFVATVVLLPLSLTREHTPVSQGSGRMERLLDALAHALVTHRLRVGLVAAALVALAGYGASLVQVDTYSLGYLPHDHRVVVDHEQIEGGWGPYFTLELMVEPEALRADQGAVLRATEAFVERASEHPRVARGFAAPLLYRRMAEVFSDGEFEGPLDDALVAQLNLVLSMQDLEWDRDEPAFRDNVLAPFVSREADLARITFVVDMLSAARLAEVITWLETVAAEEYGSLARARVTGYPDLYVAIIDHVISSQTRSFWLALGLIFLIMWLALRSVRLALISLVPNVLPVVAMLGVMGALGIDLDIATATIAAIMLGVAIDDTIHFLWAWRDAERQGLTWSSAVPQVLRRAGRPALTTSVVLVAGFWTLMVSDVGSVYAFGLLISVGAIAALLADLFVLPLLLGLRPELEVKPWNRHSRSRSPSPAG